MVERLTVIFFIILCLLLGLNLTLLPWISVGGIGDWGDNYLLVFLTEGPVCPSFSMRWHRRGSAVR